MNYHPLPDDPAAAGQTSHWAGRVASDTVGYAVLSIDWLRWCANVSLYGQYFRRAHADFDYKVGLA